MAHLYESHRFVLEQIPFVNGKTVLDVGCGKGVWGSLIRAEKKGDDTTIIGFDKFLPYLDFIEKNTRYDVLKLADATQKFRFGDKSVDVTLAIEIIEHLPRKKADFFMDELERVTREKIIISTPNGAWDLGVHNPIRSEMHMSAYDVSFFKKRGYHVLGMGFKYFKLYTAQKHSLQKLWASIFYMFTPISYLFPRLGEFLVAIKEL